METCHMAEHCRDSESESKREREIERFLSLLTFSEGPGVVGLHTPTIDPYPCSYVHHSPYTSLYLRLLGTPQ